MVQTNLQLETLQKIALFKLLFFLLIFQKLKTMTNFDILSTEQLLEVKGGSNELTTRDVTEDCIV